MIVQIYEIQTPAEAEQMLAQGVDHIGSVVVSADTWKDTNLKQAVAITQNAGRKSSLIPLFTDTELIAGVVEYYQPDILHFCETLPAGEPSQRIISEIKTRQLTIRKRFPGLEIMRSIPIGRAGQGSNVASLAMAEIFEPISDWFLTDTLLSNSDQVNEQDQPVAGYVGITGQTCDWDVAAALVDQSKIPVILAGGIGPQNVAAGIAKVRPAGVDSCTRTNAVDSEGQPIRFKKDTQMVCDLVTSARNARG